ncbi:signal peptidase II [Gleimia sp. 6138-11-ORH1]|uniref:signal peptidase II n=1 Tax=Gleimia sp. 6138-11-ORH1 TaxID=2973937 RepID=UPI0021674559|nr:signal peptidase II [Gleimia sp. 6138-11-ORH1]MCS4484531.1 signal peptidase II [Gleimia sp. 6138-11-ORH1]
MVQSRSKTPYLVFLFVGILGIVSDYLTKEWAIKNLSTGTKKPLIGDIITLQLHYNPGAAFSSLVNATWIITILAVLVILFLFYYAYKVQSLPWAVALGLLLGGAGGNLIDRLIREPGFGTGHVIDFLNYADFFIGNVADIWIVCAGALIVLLTLTNHAATATEEKESASLETKTTAAGEIDG